MNQKKTDKPSFTERKGTVKCPSCGSIFEIVSTSKDGTQTVICANCDLDKTPDYATKSHSTNQ
jgi:uncharacterized Zn finger protein (UPF0148 family)